jgi:hypothetical protein
MARAELSEADFMDQVIRYARLMGWRVAHFRKVRVQRGNGSVYWETPVAADGKGFLDLVLVRDRVVVVELKVGTNKPTREQDEWITAWTRAGVETYVWKPSMWAEIEKVLGR